jgi:hypothetical protein
MSRSNTAKKLVAVDEEVAQRYAAAPLSPFGNSPEAEWLRHHIRRERSGAYWFAAAKWGFLGLVVGVCLGAAMMYMASVSTIDLASEAVARGVAIQSAQEAVNTGFSRPAPPTP